MFDFWSRAGLAVADAEQILLDWAGKMNYIIISIAPAGKAMCRECDLALKAASEAQEALYGVRIFYF